MSLHSSSSVNGEGSTPKDPLYKILDEERIGDNKQEPVIEHKEKEKEEEEWEDEEDQLKEKPIIVLTLLYSIAGVCNILHGTLLDMNMIICQIRMVINTVVVSHCSWELLLSMTSKVLKGIGL